MKLFYTVLIISLFGFSLQSQVIVNAYARVSSITGGSVINVTNVNETNHTFTAGDNVIIMQMQDNVIGTNTTNVSTFGDLGAIGNAGKYEIGYIQSRQPAVGTATTINLVTPLNGTYNIGSQSSVQLISMRNLGGNYTTTASITGLAWDGNVGGVVAIRVTNTLTLNHSISANALGFRGGSRSASAGGSCDPTTYMTSSTARGYKGEGIYRSTDANFVNGRGHILTGGGGGNEHNAGGAGGGNYSAGGAGGPGYGCGTPAGGLGGITLSVSIGANRIFMGGGGGGGGQNNNFNSDGGRGGGIVLIKAGAITTNTNCSGVSITANGAAAANVGNDGAGGGGAGGSIVLDVASFSVVSACSLTIASNGGNGGDVTDGTVHAGGGGGGQGAVLYSIAQPTANITSNSLNGNGGKNNSAGTSSASPGGGSSNSGIIPATGGGTLPVELTRFGGYNENGRVNLHWTTATEKNNDFFSIDKSQDGITFETLGTYKGAGTSLSERHYQAQDPRPYEGVTYYRLLQTDHNGRAKHIGLIAVSAEGQVEFSVYPNPVSVNETLSIGLHKRHSAEPMEVQLYDMTGKKFVDASQDAESILQLNLRSLGLERGVYLLKVKNGYYYEIKKLLVE